MSNKNQPQSLLDNLFRRKSELETTIANPPEVQLRNVEAEIKRTEAELRAQAEAEREQLLIEAMARTVVLRDAVIVRTRDLETAIKDLEAAELEEKRLGRLIPLYIPASLLAAVRGAFVWWGWFAPTAIGLPPHLTKEEVRRAEIEKEIERAREQITMYGKMANDRDAKESYRDDSERHRKEWEYHLKRHEAERDGKEPPRNPFAREFPFNPHGEPYYPSAE